MCWTWTMSGRMQVSMSAIMRSMIGSSSPSESGRVAMLFTIRMTLPSSDFPVLVLAGTSVAATTVTRCPRRSGEPPPVQRCAARFLRSHSAGKPCATNMMFRGADIHGTCGWGVSHVYSQDDRHPGQRASREDS